jgi:hypothetical protein
MRGTDDMFNGVVLMLCLLLQEDAYEWNSSHQPAGKSGPIDEAPRKWRLKINSNETKGAFDGWKVRMGVIR